MAVLIAVTLAAGCVTRSTGKVPEVIIPHENCPQHPLDDVRGIENFGFVSAELWRGGQPNAEGYRTLQAMHVGTVIDLELPNPRVPPAPRAVNPHSLPVSEWHSDQVDTTALLVLIRDSPKPVFIHCRQGRDRTGIAVAAYRLSRGMPIADVVKELHNFRVNFWWAPSIERRIRQLSDLMLARELIGPPQPQQPRSPAG